MRWLLISARAAVAASLLVILAPLAASAQAPCPSPVPTAVAPPNLTAPAATLVPDDACIPAMMVNPPVPLEYFDDYSWRAFIALVWPALKGQRGVPDPGLPITTTGVPLVFETYKADWETFQPNGAPPSEFNSNESYWTGNPSQSPCPLVKPGDFLLAPIAKFGNVGLAGTGDLVAVLVAQNGTFVRYLAAYNQTEFNQILKNQYFLAANLPQNKNPVGPNIVFQNGSIDIKSAWIDMTNVPNPGRYYTRPAWLVDPISGKCTSAAVSVGLVGLHIVQKTPTRPQWIWSTFEQIDNVTRTKYTDKHIGALDFIIREAGEPPELIAIRRKVTTTQLHDLKQWQAIIGKEALVSIVWLYVDGAGHTSWEVTSGEVEPEPAAETRN